MSNLTCVPHGRRVVVVNNAVVIHRNGDGSRCAEGAWLIRKGVKISPRRVMMLGTVNRVEEGFVKATKAFKNFKNAFHGSMKKDDNV